MMRKIITILTLLLSKYSLCQEADTIRLKHDLPVKNGYVLILRETDQPRFINPMAGIIVHSFQPSVDSIYAFAEGIVSEVRNMDGEFICILKKHDYLYTYARLKSCVLTKGMRVNRGTFIGCMIQDDGEVLSQIIISKRNSILPVKNHIEILNGKH